MFAKEAAIEQSSANQRARSRFLTFKIEAASMIRDITMTNQELLGEFLELPPEAQTEVLRLIAFLKQKHQQEESTSALPNADLKNDSFMGMWRDRPDLDDSSAWV